MTEKEFLVSEISKFLTIIINETLRDQDIY